MTKVIEFAEWLEVELKARNWNQSDLVRRSGISSGLISQILSGQRAPGPKVCRGIAHAFGMRDVQVMEIAGIASDFEKPRYSTLVEAAAAMLSELPDEDQEEIRALLRFKLERQRSRKAKKDEKPVG